MLLSVCVFSLHERECPPRGPGLLPCSTDSADQGPSTLCANTPSRPPQHTSATRTHPCPRCSRPIGDAGMREPARRSPGLSLGRAVTESQGSKRSIPQRTPCLLRRVDGQLRLGGQCVRLPQQRSATPALSSSLFPVVLWACGRPALMRCFNTLGRSTTLASPVSPLQWAAGPPSSFGCTFHRLSHLLSDPPNPVCSRPGLG